MTVENGQFWGKAWNPLRVKGGGWHCTKVSPGCQNCWSEALNLRFGNRIRFDHWKVEFELDQRILEQPLHWKKPRVIATQWLGDLGHELIGDLFIKNIIFASEAYNWHKYLFLTKRIERLKNIFEELYSEDVRPYDNLWLGVSICTQKEADEKIPVLLKTPAVHRYINFEPLLGAVRPWDHSPDDCPTWYDGCNCQEGIDWVLLGAESGPGRRPMKLEWVRSIVEQCQSAGVPLFIKQLNINGKVSKDMNEFPEDLRVRQWPW